MCAIMSFSPLSPPAAVSASQVSDAGSGSASIPASAASSQATNMCFRQGSDRQYFLQYVKIAEERQRCTLCNLHWSLTTSSTIIAEHFQNKHKKVFASRPRAQAESSGQLGIEESFSKSDCTFDDVVNLFVHHPSLPLSLANSKHFRKVLKSSSRVTQRGLRQALVKKDKREFGQLKDMIANRGVGIQIDGGKNISKTKLLGICVVADQKCYCWNIVYVEDATVLTEEFYKELLLRAITEIQTTGAVVISVTLDNEASPNAGVRLLQEIMPHIIHNRCYAHTAELLIADLQSTGTATRPHSPAIPILHDVIENVHRVVTLILQNKYLRAALEEAQRDRAQRPLMLVKTANTRKWSSSFLMLSRLVRLYDYVATMERFIATDRPEPTDTQCSRSSRRCFHRAGRVFKTVLEYVAAKS
jgi:hypothetical protein